MGIKPNRRTYRGKTGIKELRKISPLIGKATEFVLKAEAYKGIDSRRFLSCMDEAMQLNWRIGREDLADANAKAILKVNPDYSPKHRPGIQSHQYDELLSFFYRIAERELQINQY
ncbi:hypothetical protein COU60_03935 [Candidatus Pacearchaeota archaeon CG10_big_fil_rev_8_21_14_0_10_34_76]|nr:MAG: hypothetical protein COU60_03935 [Candidatus Pacearchaeota archaeon CG10_big_fil_rev_8_21_14_0_10_34_76]